MKSLYSLSLLVLSILALSQNLKAQNQRGYYDAPYVRYEADKGTLVNASVTSRSFAQADLQSEASEQVCVNMTTVGSSVSWTVSSDGDGLVVRFSVPDNSAGSFDVYANNVFAGTMAFSAYYSWESLWDNGNPNNNNIKNKNKKMRFDEQRLKLSTKVLAGQTLKIVNKSGSIHLDFAELELVPAAVGWASGNVTYTGNGSNLQNFIDANGGKTIYIPAGVYKVDRQLYLGQANTKIKGAGMWYTEINFTATTANKGGFYSNASGVSLSDLYLTTVKNSRSDSYKAINGVYLGGSTINNVWAEHFECGAWIAQYNTGPVAADGLVVSNCRFRNNYADGINLAKGAKNCIVEHTSFRNNGDDDMAIWSQSNQECINNTYRYNTSENCWRASGVAIYGGQSNKAHHLLIRDNIEVGIRVGNNFPGSPFNTTGTHEFSDITILRCGTFNDLFNLPVGAIDILVDNVAGNKVNNVKFSNINITDSKNDAIYIYKKNSGSGFYNLVFENITVSGTGLEYPQNDFDKLGWGRGFGILFVGNPTGNSTYCNMSYEKKGGNADVYVKKDQIGSLSWTVGTCVTPNCNAVTIPAKIQAETYCDMYGIQLETTTDIDAGQNVGYFDAGDYLSYRINVPSANTYKVEYRVATDLTATNSIKLQSSGGVTTFGSVDVTNSGGWQTWKTVSHLVQLKAGIQEILLTSPTGGFNINWVQFSVATGIEDKENQIFSMYPNPVGEFLTVNTQTEINEFIISDAAGRVIINQINPGSNFNVDFRNFAPGFYTVVAIDAKYKKQISKLIKYNY